MSRSTIIAGSIFYFLFCLAIFFFWVPKHLAFVGDSLTYSLGGVHLLNLHLYSQDGVHPFLEREPVYSFFLAMIYAVFGVWNSSAIFLIQALLYWILSILFVTVLARTLGTRIATICFFILLSSPSVLHGVFIVYREAFVLCLFLLLAIGVLSIVHRDRLGMAIMIGVVLGLIPLAYYSFIALPFFVIFYLWFERVSKRSLFLILSLTVVIVSAWGFRNQSIDGKFRIAGFSRSTIMWYVRGEQAERVHGLEPLRCLWSEYVSRDWTGRSDACSFNYLMNTKWPKGESTIDRSVAVDAFVKIRSHFGWYLWGSLFQVLELHLPFVGGGWPFIFNLLAAIGTFFLYLGCLFAWRSVLDRRLFFFLLLIAYNAASFGVIAATPRYLIPVSFCYAVFAAIGYEKILKHFGFFHQQHR